MLFNVIRTEGMSNTLVSLILAHADVKVENKTVNVPTGYNDSITDARNRVVVDGLLSQNQVDRLSQCFSLNVSTRNLGGDTFLIYSFNHSCM